VQVKAKLKVALWQQNMSREAQQFNTSTFNVDMQRQFHKIQDIGSSALQDVAKLEKVNTNRSLSFFLEKKDCLVPVFLFNYHWSTIKREHIRMLVHTRANKRK
jgi:hypothetical protein